VKYPRPGVMDLRVVASVRVTKGWKPTADRFGLSVSQVKTIVRRNAIYEKDRLIPFIERAL
jgi:hypothetical protein